MKSGFNGNSYVAENKKSDVYARLDMDFSKSTNVVTENGELLASLLLSPGQISVVHHVMPAIDTEGWSCGWKCSGAFLSKEEYEIAIAAEKK